MKKDVGSIITDRVQYSRVSDLPGLELFQSIATTRFIPRHVHQLFCLSITEAGVRVCQTKKGRDFLTPGAIFISHCGESHSGNVPQGHTYSCRSLRLDPTLLESLVSQFGIGCLDSLYFPSPLLYDQELYRRIRQFHVSASQPSSTLSMEYQLFDVFSLLLTRYSALIDPFRPREEATPIRRVCEYLQEHFAEDVSIEKLASIAALSPFHLCRVFERKVGVPPHIYQLDIRLTRAAQMLALGKHIADVAVDTGFYDQSHFHKAFRRKFGITPKRYKQS